MPWFAILTKSRNEKKVTERLRSVGIEAYCPIRTEVKQWTDRKKKIEVPLIPSYVFVCLDERERDKVFVVSGVVRYLHWLGKPAQVKDEEIAELQKLTSLEGVEVEVVQWQPGSIVSIPSGPFRGMEGILERVEKRQVHIILEELGVRIIVHRKQ
ncbi:MAG: antitermination protein NusG [Flavobacterium sp. BFFFF2]|nr:MAG: antitermination protein NusG [Flavobacterium sp. BFFFF2]